MLAKRALLVFFLCAATALAADLPQLTPLKGEKFRGDLVSVTDKEIVLKVDGKSVATPVGDTLTLDFGPIADAKTTPHTLIELIDGSVLRCNKVSFKGKNATVTTLAGMTVTIPIASLKTVQKEANDVGIIASWKQRMETIGKPTHDILFRKAADGKLQPTEGTFYDANDEGDKIEFLTKDDQEAGNTEKKLAVLDRIAGMSFRRAAAVFPKSLLSRVSDTQGSTLMTASVELKDGKFVVTTVSGATAELPATVVAKLDYSKGKFTYLSDYNVAQMRVVEKGAMNDPKMLFPFKRDTNLEGSGPIMIGGKSYPKGLSVHAYSDFTFELDGAYREFKMVVGIDDNIKQGFDAPAKIRVEADGKELTTLDVTRKDGAKPVTLNVLDVQRLRIIVSGEKLFGISCHAALADALVTK
jgi:NPCBM/NEW2 domain